MSPAPYVRLETSGQISRLTIDRPSRRNALSAEVLHHLADALTCAVEGAPRVIVLTGHGSAFSSGGDLTSADAEDTSPLYREIYRQVHLAPQPVIARVNGPAVGGAVGLVAACDLVIAAEEAIFSFPEVQMGLAPTLAALTVVPRVGMGDALSLFLLGEAISARRAAEIGLVTRVAPQADLDMEVARWAAMLSAASPAAVSACKRLARDLAPAPPAEAYEWVSELTRQLASSRLR